MNPKIFKYFYKQINYFVLELVVQYSDTENKSPCSLASTWGKLEKLWEWPEYFFTSYLPSSLKYKFTRNHLVVFILILSLPNNTFQLLPSYWPSNSLKVLMMHKDCRWFLPLNNQEERKQFWPLL